MGRFPRRSLGGQVCGCVVKVEAWQVSGPRGPWPEGTLLPCQCPIHAHSHKSTHTRAGASYFSRPLDDPARDRARSAVQPFHCAQQQSLPRGHPESASAPCREVFVWPCRNSRPGGREEADAGHWARGKDRGWASWGCRHAAAGAGAAMAATVVCLLWPPDVQELVAGQILQPRYRPWPLHSRPLYSLQQ